MIKKRALFLTASAAAVSISSGAAASILPFGPQNDVSYSTVVNEWGWTEIYRDDYGNQNYVPTDDVFAGAQTYVMLAGMREGSSTIDVLAATTLAELLTFTATNQTHLSNGSQWYFNNLSLGFAGANDVINQTSADTNGQAERDRLSWHTELVNGETALQYGWRSGSNVNLNSASNWNRVVFTTSSIGAVPEPGTWAMMLVGFGAVGGAMRAGKRRQKVTVTYA